MSLLLVLSKRSHGLRNRCTAPAFTTKPSVPFRRTSGRRDSWVNGMISSRTKGKASAFVFSSPSSLLLHPSCRQVHPPCGTSCFLSTATTSTTNQEVSVSQDEDEEDLQEIYQELQWLSAEIRRHDALYYNNNDNDNPQEETSPIITDEDYDALVRREEDICNAYPALLLQWERESGLGKQATRVGGRVGTISQMQQQPSSFQRFQKKRNHLTPMLSLDNVTTQDQLKAWLERLRKRILAANNSQHPAPVTILTEPKLDGLSLSLRYTLQKDSTTTNNPQYQLEWACTRGDGKKGQDVTAPVVEGLKLPTVLALISTVKDKAFTSLPDTLEVRGEVVMPKSTFQQLKEDALHAEEEIAASANHNSTNNQTTAIQKFSNARNAASGILLRKEEEVMGNSTSSTSSPLATHNNNTRALQSKLVFYAYDIAAQDNPEDIEWMQDALATRQQLEAWGFRVPLPMAVTTLDWKPLQGSDGGNVTAEAAQNNTTGDDTLGFEEWTDQNILPMTEYHDGFGRYRQSLAATTTKAADEAAADDDKYQWGDYDMDGCVHKVSHQSLRHVIGNSNRAPRWAVAHKFPAQSAITKLVGIEVQVGRKTGALTPVAILEPIELEGGVTVTRATLHNFQHLQQMLLGSRQCTDIDGDGEMTNTTSDRVNVNLFLATGSKVLVRRAGDVIPQVVQLAEPPKLATADMMANNNSSSWIDLSAPLHCPACGSPTIADAPTSRAETGGQVVRCGGPQLLCAPRAVGALVHAFSRDALDVSGLSEARIQQLSMLNSSKSDEGTANDTTLAMNASLVKLQFPSDIFKIAQNPEAVEVIANLPGWGPKSAQNLANAANQVARNGVSLARFIYSLAIRYAGVHSSKIVATAYGNVDAFLQAMDEASESSVDTADAGNQPFAILADKSNTVNKGIGPSLLSSLVEFSREPELVAAAKELASVIKVHDDEDFSDAGILSTKSSDDSDATKPLQGLKVVFTGSLGSANLTRKEAQALAMSMGAKSTPGTISKATDLVVVGEKAGGKKLESARNLGIRIIDLKQFMSLARDNQ
ncbi:DNA ligase [Seminavis robusta]|uniref:DNA ligase (NAD(+)) n=1 Tax=Seminavis robusta TaxID=568900 RepID=A0A9N8ECD0_9STRA|nr:DNA ligase [Seminavis robusta]|eukprot:Sro966_g225710.1 DNA ligase (1047) ;mRNA; f:21089-24229